MSLTEECVKNGGYKLNEKNELLNKKGRVLSIYLDKKGYPAFTAHLKDGRCTRIHVHKLKAYQLYGDKIFTKGIQVRHLDGNKLDYSNENIAIGTQRDNTMDIPHEQRVKQAKISASKLRKFKIGEVEEIRKMVKYGIKAIDIAKIYKVAKSTIYYIVNKKTYI